jgi:putative phage-type endonuclease
VKQLTAEWFEIRAGKVTASRVYDVISKTKSGGYAAGRADYHLQLVTERLSKQITSAYVTPAMQWGIDREPEARVRYQSKYEMVDEVGFVAHPMIPDSGASPDGLVSTEGQLEIKCPNLKTHYETLITGKIQARYITQMQWQMACTGRAWCDYFSYDPRAEEGLEFFCKRVDRDVEYIHMLEMEVSRFLDEVTLTVEKLNKLRQVR